MSDGITDEARVVAGKQINAVMACSQQYGMCPHDYCRCRKAADAALEAALPLLVGGERERAAKIADDYAASVNADLDLSEPEAECASDTAMDIAEAIRADTGGGTRAMKGNDDGI